MKKFEYEAPAVECFSVLVEQGFTVSKVESGDFEQGTEESGTWE